MCSRGLYHTKNIYKQRTYMYCTRRKQEMMVQLEEPVLNMRAMPIAEECSKQNSLRLSSWARYLVNPFIFTLFPSRLRNSSNAWLPFSVPRKHTQNENKQNKRYLKSTIVHTVLVQGAASTLGRRVHLARQQVHVLTALARTLLNPPPIPHC